LVSKSFRQHHHFEREGKAFDHVCFPETLVASIVASQGDIPIEIGLIGCEGMTGMAAVLGTGQSPNATFVQIAGEGLVISIADFSQALNQSASIRPALLKYFPVLTLQTAHTAIANSVGNLPIRLARWLLMAHDRVNGNELVLYPSVFGAHAGSAPGWCDRSCERSAKASADQVQPWSRHSIG